MAENNFKPFATSAGANVISQADWEVLATLDTGFQGGKASSSQMNKAIRQSSVISSVIAQFIANRTGSDVLDNGDTATILTNLLAALFNSPALTGTPTAPTPAQATNSTQIATTEFVAGAISKFSSGSFEKLLSTAGYQKLPSGFIVQWGTLSMSSTTQNEYTILPFTFPVTFPNALFALTSGLRTGLATNAYTSYSLELATNSGASWYYITGVSSIYPTINWIAIGY